MPSVVTTLIILLPSVFATGKYTGLLMLEPADSFMPLYRPRYGREFILDRYQLSLVLTTLRPGDHCDHGATFLRMES